MFDTHINVALVEDEPETHARLLAAIASEADIHLLFHTNAGEPMLKWLDTQAEQDNLCVLMVDLGLPDMHGLDVIRYCKKMVPKAEIMVITMFGDEANMIRAFEAGATGYVLKDGIDVELIEHIRTLRAGGSPMSPIIARQLLQRMGRQKTASRQALQVLQGLQTTFSDTLIGQDNLLPVLPAPPSPATDLVSVPQPNADSMLERLLTEREEQVLQFLARGYTYGELAKSMGVTINTIQTHIRGLYAKLQVHSKSEALLEARQKGLLPY